MKKSPGMSDAAVLKATGCDWKSWIWHLDKAGCAEKSHKEIAALVAKRWPKIGGWWAQMVTVGYERIRGLRERGQQRDGGYQVTRSRTFNVPVDRLFAAFISRRLCSRWLPKGVILRSMTANKRVRLGWTDGTQAVVGFTAKSSAKSIAAVQHEKLSDRAQADAMKRAWGERFDILSDLLETN